MCVHEMQVEKHGTGARQQLKAVAIDDDDDRQFGHLAKQSKSKYLVWFSLVKENEELNEWQEEPKKTKFPPKNPANPKRKPGNRTFGVQQNGHQKHRIFIGSCAQCLAHETNSKPQELGGQRDQNDGKVFGILLKQSSYENMAKTKRH